MPSSKIRRILVPCDGSPPSIHALEKAVEFGDSLKDAEIVMLYVIPEIELPPQYDASGDLLPESPDTNMRLGKTYTYLKTKALETLDKIWKKVVAGKSFHNVRIEVMLGSPISRIVECAEKEEADLIIMGNVGLHGISKIRALGSVSRGVSEQAKSPVMIVPYVQLT